jgi:chemotaxis protein MotB
MADKQAPVIIIKKKRPAHHGAHGGAWKVAYADFVTAMMCFFLVMWLINSSEETKAAIAAYFDTTPGSGSPISEYPTPPKGGDKMDTLSEVNPPGGRPINLPAGKTNAATTSEAELQNLKEVLEETISLELGVANPSDNLEMVYDSKGLVLRIAIKGFFDHNESVVKQDLLPVLYRIGKVLQTSHRMIRLEGHTDGTEGAEGRSIASGAGPAWDLSTKRAAWVADYWIKNFPSMKPERLQVAGAAHFHPLADNSTAEGQSVNRRVEVIVLNEQYK